MANGTANDGNMEQPSHRTGTYSREHMSRACGIISFRPISRRGALPKCWFVLVGLFLLLLQSSVTAGKTPAAPTGTISVDLNAAQYPFRGIGWNVAPTNFQYGDWNQIKANLDSMQMQFVRVIMQPETWYPTSTSFVTTSPEMQAYAQFLQYCQANNITVWVNNWWTGGKYDSAAPPWPNHYWWLANVCYLDPTNQYNLWSAIANGDSQGPETDHPYSDDAFAQVVTKVVDYWVNTMGLTSIKYLGIWNEPNGIWAYNPRPIGSNVPANYIQGMNRLYNKTWWYDKYGYNLGSIKLVGSDYCATTAADSMSDIGTMLSSWEGGRQVDDYLDAISFHSYAPDYGGLCYNTKMQIYNNNHDGAIEPILVGEIGDNSINMSTAQGRADQSMDCARKIVGYAKQGAYTVLRWWYNGSWAGFEWGATDSTGQTIVNPQHFNPVKLFCNTLPKTSSDYYVLSTTAQGSSPYSGSYFDAVCLAFWDPVAGRNKTAIWLVNNSVDARPIQVSFQNLTSSKTFRKKLVVMSGQYGYACTIDDYGNGFTATPGTPSFSDNLWGRCVQVYVEE